MKKIDLTQGKVMSVLTALALPIMATSLLQFTYNIVDMFWVGGLGSNAVASIGSSSFYVGLGYSINALVVTGVGITVSQAIGRKNDKEVKEYINAGLFLNLIIGILFGTIIIFFGKEFISYLNIKNLLVEKDAYVFLAWNAPILFFSFFNFLYSRIMNSFGDTKGTLIINLVGILINIVLDPIMIYTLNLKVLGAAIATLIANVAMFIAYIYKTKELIYYDFDIGIKIDKIKRIFTLGFPMSAQRVLFTLINIQVARVVAEFGANAIAAQKIGLQIESITYMVVGGLNGAIASFTGQNFGAKNIERVKQGYRTSLKLGIIYAAITSLAFLLLDKTLIRIFIDDKNTIIIGAKYLRIIAFSQIFSAIEMISNGVLSGIGKPKIPSIISIAYTSLRIPMAIGLSYVYGINGVWASIAISSVLKGITVLMISIKKLGGNYVRNN